MKNNSCVVSLIILSFLLGFLLMSCHKKVDEKSSNMAKDPTPFAKEKILYIDSYNLDFPWVQGITKGILDTLDIAMDSQGNLDDSNSRYELNIFHMETKRNPSTESIEEAALEALSQIKSWKPDVIITSDDNAAKFLIVPYLMNSEIPIVFCGINWDASVYGFPTPHITGMIEVNLIDKMIEELLNYSAGNRIGYIRDDTTTSRKESVNYEKLLGISIMKKFPRTFDQWKKDFLDLQEETDIVLVGYPSALDDWDGNTEPYVAFLRENTLIPTGSWDQWTADWVLMSLALIAEEQGEYAASTALRILEGESPGNIPVVRNQKAKVYINMGFAKKLGVIFPMDLIEISYMVEDWQTE